MIRHLPNIDFCRPCRDCGEVVGFNDNIRSADGKSRIPLDIKTGLGHTCQKVIRLQDSSQSNPTLAVREDRK